MKQIKYLNGVLTIIAVCLILITLAVTGLLPSANAGTATGKYLQVPVNPDGSINVKFSPNDVLDVNIESCDRLAFHYAEPIEVKIHE
jgi:hypothetical protein